MPQITVLDTTLRDGEQSPGATMTPGEKLRVARGLELLGVDVVEAGFAAASPSEVEAVSMIADELQVPVVGVLCRATESDIDAAAAAVEKARKPRIHTFIATSEIHRRRKLGISKEECLDRVGRAVRRARRFVDDVEFTAEDATRTDLDFLCSVIRVAVEAGATCVNLPDTVGTSYPSEIARMFSTVARQIPGIEAVVLSAHCHDDLGLAVANTLSAVEHGARQVECTVNGIGERAGNASLEEVVMALDTLAALSAFTTGVQTERLVPTSRLVGAVTGIRPPPNKAIVGANAFAHEAGIHQDGVLKARSTYEILDPARVGAAPTRLVLGKHSGRAALNAQYEALGFDLGESELNRVYRLFMVLAETKKEVFEEDLLAIYYRGAMSDAPGVFRLEHLEVQCGRRPSTAMVCVRYRDEPPQSIGGVGDGPIDAAFDALGRVSPWPTRLEEFSIEATTPGREAVGSAHLQILVGGWLYRGSAASTDIVDASVRAFLNALDKADYACALEARSFERDTPWGV